MEELQGLLAVGGAGDGESLRVKLGDKDAGLLDVPGLTGGGHITLALGEDEELVMLGHGVDIRSDGAAGLQGAVGEVGLIELTLQNGHTGVAVDKVILDAAVAGHLDLRHVLLPP